MHVEVYKYRSLNSIKDEMQRTMKNEANNLKELLILLY